MDFIEKLLFLSRCNTILVIIDQLFKLSIFVLIVDTITLHKLAKIFVIHVFSKHSILSHITSNYELKFISNFFQSLETTLDIQLYFIFEYHTEKDSQTEYTNQMLVQNLQVYYNYQQDN